MLINKLMFWAFHCSFSRLLLLGIFHENYTSQEYIFAFVYGFDIYKSCIIMISFLKALRN